MTMSDKMEEENVWKIIVMSKDGMNFIVWDDVEGRTIGSVHDTVGGFGAMDANQEKIGISGARAAKPGVFACFGLALEAVLMQQSEDE